MGESSDSASDAHLAPHADATASRRIGRPRGPERIARTVRLLEAHDRRLAAEVERQGLSPQYLIEQALTEYFKRLDRRRRRNRNPAEDPTSTAPTETEKPLGPAAS